MYILLLPTNSMMLIPVDHPQNPMRMMEASVLTGCSKRISPSEILLNKESLWFHINYVSFIYKSISLWTSRKIRTSRKNRAIQLIALSRAVHPYLLYLYVYVLFVLFHLCFIRKIKTNKQTKASSWRVLICGGAWMLWSDTVSWRIKIPPSITRACMRSCTGRNPVWSKSSRYLSQCYWWWYHTFLNCTTT